MDALRWDHLEQTIYSAIIELTDLAETIPTDMEHTTARNRMTMAAMHLEDARDRLAAARARLPQKQDNRA